jgi:hypothetical protein
MQVSNIKCKIKYYISTMVICGSYMHAFSVSKDIKKRVNNDKRRPPTYLVAFQPSIHLSIPTQQQIQFNTNIRLSSNITFKQVDS